MKHFSSNFILFFITHIFISEAGYAFLQDDLAPIDSTFHKELSQGLKLVDNARYSEAILVFDSLEQVFPDHPAPNFFKAATYQNWMLTFRINTFQNVFYENTELAIEKGNTLLESDTDPWLNFYVGAAYGFKALHLFRQHNWIQAYFNGRDGIDNFYIALQKSPNLYDCYYGLGSYHYWRSAKSKFISFLVFWMEDKRKIGLDELQLSIDKGRYTTYEATHGLLIAYYHHGDYEKALNLSSQAMQLTEIPSLSSLYLRGRVLVKFEKWQEVQDVFQQVLKRLVEHPYPSVSFQVECQYWIAEALVNQNKADEAYKIVKNALAQSENWVAENELESALEGFETILEWLEELNDKLEDNMIYDSSSL